VDGAEPPGVVAAGRAQQPDLGLDLLEGLVAVAEALVVVADGEVEAHPRVEERPQGTDEDVGEPVLEAAVVGDVAEEDDVAVGPPLVGLGHLAGDGHRLPAAAAVVADGDERHPVVGGGPGPGPEDDVGGLPGDEVLAGEQRQHVATEADAGRHGPGGSQGRPQELSPVHATRATWGAGALPAPLTTLRDLPGRDEGRCGGRSLGTARGALTAP